MNTVVYKKGTNIQVFIIYETDFKCLYVRNK